MPKRKLSVKYEPDYRIMHINNNHKQRTCLMCGREFLSTWIGHRRCPKCAHVVEQNPGAYKHVQICKVGNGSTAMKLHKENRAT